MTLNPLSRSSRLLVPAMMLCAGLAGCARAPTPKTLYGWGDYQTQVYSYLNGDPRAAQIAVLVGDLKKITAGGKTPPPGYHAQLGLLYVDAGSQVEAIREFREEEALFPESATYMDFVMSSMKAQEHEK
jgi:hypothetical protein